GGAGAAVSELQGAPEPADYDKFWAAQRARLAEVPVKATLMEVPSSRTNFVAFDVRVECPGGKPVSGYLTVPKIASPKSLKAFLGFRGYGVSSGELIFMGDKICFSINAHGIDNGQEQSYYRKLAEGELRNYGFSKAENAKPETSYFNGMFLRVLRALDYVKTRPEWNGKDLIVSGGSQGGLQALVGAAFDKDVTSCDVSIPWFCDLQGSSLGRIKASWLPEFADGLAYYDGANLGKRVRCPVKIVAGLGDRLSPPATVMVLYNNLSCSKRIEMFQGMIHQPFPPHGAQSFVLRVN
ncbi:MAG TPA: acetylxylan esterase, partial [Candidatus Paceibacterota bacterium]|nr:acetylxylan esterase [Candidatus Paceibacterota bacterium]